MRTLYCPKTASVSHKAFMLTLFYYTFTAILVDIIFSQVYDVACGYGFTLFAAKRGRRHMVLGTGINTDSQLGYHEYPKKSGTLCLSQ